MKIRISLIVAALILCAGNLLFAQPNISYANSPAYIKRAVAVGTAPNPTLTITNSGTAVVTTLGYSSTATQPLSGGSYNNPYRGAVDAAGNIYICNFTGNTISKFTSAGALISNTYTSGGTLAGPSKIVFDSSGNMWVLNANATLLKYNSAGTFVSTTTLTLGGTTNGMCIDASDNLYITSYGTTDYIIKVTSALVQTTLVTGGNLNDPVGIDNSTTNLYILNRAGSNVTIYSTAGAVVRASHITGLGTTPEGIFVDDINSLTYVTNNTAGTIGIYALGTGSNISASTSITSVSNCRGLFGDGKGNVYAPDFTNNLVYMYRPTGRYFKNKALPAGLTMSVTTGAITGTATTSTFDTYNISGYAANGGSTTVLTLNTFLEYTWGGGDNTWQTASNWTPATVPGPYDRMLIGLGTYSLEPIIGTTETIGSIIIGTTDNSSVNITVNGTLNVNGDITYQSDANSFTNNAFISGFDGTGTVNAANLKIAATTSLTTYTLKFTSSVSNLNLSGNISLTGNYAASKIDNSTFTISDGTVTASKLITSNGANAASTSTLVMSNTSTLNFTGATALSSLSSNGTNTLTLGSTTTLGYTGSGAQTVYTNSAITGLASGISYQNLALSGTGIKTAPAGTLNVAGNFTNSLANDGTSYVDFTTNSIPVVFNGAAQTISCGSSSGTTFKNITFSGTGIKTVSSGVMNIAGNFTNSLANDGSNNVDFITNLTSLSFTGTTAQSLAGGSGTGTNFKNVTFNGGGTKTIASGKINVTSTGTLTLGSSTILAAGGFLTLKSDASGAAAVAAITSPSEVQGNVNVERYLTGGAAYSRGWRLLSSPVAVSNISAITPNLTYVHTMAYTTGSTGTGGGFDGTINPTFYFYRENMAPNFTSFTTNNFRGVNKINNAPASTFSFDGGDANATLPVGNGFLFFFRGDRTTTSTLPANPPISSSFTAQPTTLTATGYLNQGNITVKPWFTGASTLSYTVATPASVQGFNLVGNPYASSIDWNAVGGITKTAINANTIYIYNPKLKVYSTYDGSVGTNFNGGLPNIIPSGQGFFVKALNNTAALTFTEVSKVSTQVVAANLLLAATNPVLPTYIRLVLSQDTLNREDAVVLFKSTASPNYVQDEDADYFIGESIVHMSTRSADNHNLAINKMPFPASKQKIGLNVTVTNSGTYTLDMSEAINIPARYKIYLTDAYKKDSVDITMQPVYTFTANIADTSTFGSNRFHLVIGQSDSAYRLTEFLAAKSISGVSLIWKTVNESTNLSFTVERSNDGGATYSLLGNMGSSGLGTYSFVDRSPQAGVNIYRLKQQDVYGGLSYSQVSINYSAGNTGANSVSVYPNPAISTIKLAVTETSKAIPDNTLPDYTIAISNSVGNIIKSISTIQPGNWQNDISMYVPGIYFLRVINNNTKTVVGNSKFVKL